MTFVVNNILLIKELKIYFVIIFIILADINLKKKMKKLFTILTVVAISTTMTFAQQGSVAIGVGSNLANVSWQDYELIPTVGYFIADNMMVGTGFSMGSSTLDVEDGTFNSNGDPNMVESKESEMSISPFFRFYMNDAFFASVGIAIGSGTDDDGSTEIRTSSFGLNAGVGYSLMWNDRVCIEPSFGIATGSGSAETSIGAITISADEPSTFGMAIGLGIHIRLGGE